MKRAGDSPGWETWTEKLQLWQRHSHGVVLSHGKGTGSSSIEWVDE